MGKVLGKQLRCEESMRILVINQYYPPDSASTGRMVATVCESLAARGAMVTAVVGQPSYAPSGADASSHETQGRLTVRRLPMGRLRGRRRFAIRALGYARFLWGAWIESRRVQPPDVIVTFHNPPLLGTLGALIARRFGVPFVYIVQDIHPDILERLGGSALPGWLLGLWRKANHIALHSARLTITLSEEMRNHLVTAYSVKAETVLAIPVWAQPEFDQLASDEHAKRRARQVLGLAVETDDLVVLYAGNMGLMHPVEMLVSAAVLLRGRPIRFLLVGDGIKRRGLEQLVRRSSLENVEFMPYQGEREFQLLLQSADLCAVALQAGLEDLCLPSRAMTFMSAARPILALMPGRAPLSRDLARASAGWNANTADGVVHILGDLVGQSARLTDAGAAARSLYREKYRMEPLVRRYVDAISSVS